MPITKSAKKSLKVSRTKKAANDLKRIALSKALKKTDAKNVNQTVSLIDKAAKTGIMHKNKAARMKSQLAKKFGTPAAAKSKVDLPRLTAVKAGSQKSVKSEKPVVTKDIKKSAKGKKKTVKKSEKGK